MNIFIYPLLFVFEDLNVALWATKLTPIDYKFIETIGRRAIETKNSNNPLIGKPLVLGVLALTVIAHQLGDYKTAIEMVLQIQLSFTITINGISYQFFIKGEILVQEYENYTKAIRNDSFRSLLKKLKKAIFYCLQSTPDSNKVPSAFSESAIGGHYPSEPEINARIWSNQEQHFMLTCLTGCQELKPKYLPVLTLLDVNRLQATKQYQEIQKLKKENEEKSEQLDFMKKIKVEDDAKIAILNIEIAQKNELILKLNKNLEEKSKEIKFFKRNLISENKDSYNKENSETDN